MQGPCYNSHHTAWTCDNLPYRKEQWRGGPRRTTPRRTSAGACRCPAYVQHKRAQSGCARADLSSCPICRYSGFSKLDVLQKNTSPSTSTILGDLNGCRVFWSIHMHCSVALASGHLDYRSTLYVLILTLNGLPLSHGSFSLASQNVPCDIQGTTNAC